MQTKCPHCQTENPAEYNFCRRCGRLLQPVCPRCQAMVGADDDFCGRCGLALTPRAQFEGTSNSQWTRTPSAPVTPAANVGPASEGRSGRGTASIDEFMPASLAARLEAARSSGAMVGERRIVTMLFCDVSGSTAAAEKLDPEEWTEIMNGIFAQMIKPVYEYEGTIARLMGDALLAFFGAPIAHEDDPQRGVLAGLDILAGIKPYCEQVREKYNIEVDVRVGLNTGLVVVGAVGSDLRMEYTALGDAINLAARMEQTAKPGTVQVADATYRLVKPFFEFEALGGIEVKGKSKPIPSYRVLGPKLAEGSMRGIEGMHAPLIGREREIKSLKHILDKCQQGLGHIVCLSSEAGLGKSRLIEEAHTYWQARGFGGEWQGVGSLSYESSHAYGLFQRLIRRLCQASVTDPAASLRQELEPLVAAFPQERQPLVWQVFESLFTLPGDKDLPRLEGESFKQELFNSLLDIFTARFADQPAVLVFEDLHWSDAASIELLTRLLVTTESLPLVVICAMRPEADAPSRALQNAASQAYAHRYTEIKLPPLADDEINAILDGLLVNAQLPDKLRQDTLERANGNPFFVEEVVRSLILSGALVAQERLIDGEMKPVWVAVAGAASMDIPDNLQGLLAARIDRLEEGTRATLQLAAVIGRSFHERVLTWLESGAGNGANAQTTAHLRTLLGQQMIQEAARIPELEYIFGNPLTQEVAYNSILLKRRREYHGRVGAVMESLYPDQLAEIAPRLAYHFLQAGERQKAFTYFSLAGDTAFRLNANVEAVEHYRQAIACTGSLELTSAELIHVYGRKGRAHEILYQFDEALATYDELLALAEARQDKAIYLAVYLARTLVHATFGPRFDAELGIQYADKTLALAQELNDRETQVRVYWAKMLVEGFVQMNFKEAISLGKRALAMARAGDNTETLALILNDLGRLRGFNGQPQDGLVLTREAGPLFEQAHNLPMLSDYWNNIAMASVFAGDFDTAREAAEKALDISRRTGNQWGVKDGFWRRSNVYAETGQFGLAIDDVMSYGQIGGTDLVVGLGVLLPIYLALGQLDEARRLRDRLLPGLDSERSIFAHMMRGELALLEIRLGDLAQAEEFLRVSRQGLADPFGHVFFLYLVVAEIELALTRDDLETALAWSERAEQYYSSGTSTLLKTRCALLRAQILLRYPERQGEALGTLRQARELALRIEKREDLWQISSLLAEHCADEAERTALLAEARGVVTFIAENAGNPERRESFLSRPEVARLMP